ncbi:hypothetical protein [Streptomyces sp. Root369]|uniref:hypothetical protein n=1 Tax=Streptomyces sp. Root369 TaxID=1736523 RepID=UPI00070911B6|nr:hypothetical protein [Streptomyces sp. Root369]KQV93107.1 hypothetical protein ASD08_19585 [Streptomyces sp. Root369]
MAGVGPAPDPDDAVAPRIREVGNGGGRWTRHPAEACDAALAQPAAARLPTMPLDQCLLTHVMRALARRGRATSPIAAFWRLAR